MKRKIIYFLLALAVVMPASAQKFFKDAISLSDVSLWQQGNSLYVDMKIDMKNLTVSPERMLTLTPLLTDGQHNVALEEIIINGKRRQKAYLRGLAISRELPAGIVIPYNKREVLNYAGDPLRTLDGKCFIESGRKSMRLRQQRRDACSGADNKRRFYRSETPECHDTGGCLYSADCGGGEKP